MRAVFLWVLLGFFSPLNSVYGWGFFAHKKINYYAVFTLPAEMIGFYKYHILQISENAVNPDKRRYISKDEAARHYIDIDVYGDSAIYKMPRYWKRAVELYSEDTLQKYGIVPWHIDRMKFWLTEAFRKKDKDAILRLSADIGHYIGDAHVPLHTTANYNGQLTGQHGIHGLWESRLPEIFMDGYLFLVGKAAYLHNPQMSAWEAVISAHAGLDSVLNFERKVNNQLPTDRHFGYEERNGRVVRQYSFEYATAYHELLKGQVERQMRKSIKMAGDFWYTCWVDAGKPDLSLLYEPNKKVKEKVRRNKESSEQDSHMECSHH